MVLAATMVARRMATNCCRRQSTSFDPLSALRLPCCRDAYVSATIVPLASWKSSKSVGSLVNGAEVICYRDGSVEKINRSTGELVRTFGGNNNRGYKQVSINGKTNVVHRLICQAFAEVWEPNWGVDHINGVKSDNRPENLRQFETNSEHLREHQNKPEGCSSKYRFVSWSKILKKWRVRVQADGKTIHGGYFEDEIEAARAADVLAEKHGYGEAAFNRTKHTEV